MFKRIVDINHFKEFIDESDVKAFLNDYYTDFFRQYLSQRQISLILSTHSTGRSSDNSYDNTVFECIRDVLYNIPETPYDIMLFRGDDKYYYKDQTRPFLAHSFLKKFALTFTQSNNLYTVLIPAGSKILPTCGLPSMGAFPECEVLFDISKLKKYKNNTYIFKQ
jgi:hypothetical protein